MPEWLSNILQYIFDFSNVMNISIAASWMILAVLILRFILKKAPKWIHVALWGMVALRLLMPFSIESEFSLIPSTETISDELLRAEPIDGQQSAYLEIVTNPVYGSGVSVELDQNISSFQWDIMFMFIPWIIGMALMAMYTSISYWRLSRKVDTAVLYQDNIFQSENIGSPFVLGIIRPRIYLPFNIEGTNLEHVVAHEQAHIRRKDHWWKPLGFLLLTIHWFNPLMWLAYVLLCRDIELACDEKVIKELDNNQRADYTQALVACSVDRHMIAACPLAFGEVGVKERVKSVMNYRKPSFWGIAIAVVVCVVTAVCFLTNPLQRGEFTEKGSSVTKWVDYTMDLSEMDWDNEITIEIPEFPNVTFSYTPERIVASKSFDDADLEGHSILISGMPIWNAYFCDMTGDGLPEICASLSMGSGMIDNRIIVNDYVNGVSYELVDRGNYDYYLCMNDEDGYLYVDKKKYNSDVLVSSGRLIFKENCLMLESLSSNTESNDNKQLEIENVLGVDGSDLMEVFNNLKKGWGDETVIVTDYVYADDGAYGLDGVVQYGDEAGSPWNLAFIRDGMAHPISQDWGTDYIMVSRLSYIGNGTVSAYVENTNDGTIYECTMMFSYDAKEGKTDFVSTSTEIKDKLAEYQTDYIGDAPSVAAIAQRLPYPGGYTYSSVELQTTTEPYELMIYLDGSMNVSSEDFNYCADIAFDLIGNMGIISFCDTESEAMIASFNRSE